MANARGSGGVKQGSALPRYLFMLVLGLLIAVVAAKYLFPPKPTPLPASGPAGARDANHDAGRGSNPQMRAATTSTPFVAPTKPAERIELLNGSLAVRASARGARLLSVRLIGFSLEVGTPDSVKDNPDTALELVYHSGTPVSAFSLFLPNGPYDDPTHPLHGIVGILETSDWEMTKIPADGDHGEGVRWHLAAGPLDVTKTFRLGKTGYDGELTVEVAAKDRSLEEGRDASSSLQLLLLPGGWLYSDHDQFFPSPYVAAGHGKTEEENIVVKRASLGLKPGSDPTTPTFADLLQRPEGQRFHFVVDANKYFIAGVLPKMGPSQDALIAVKMLGVLTTDDHDRPEERVASAALLQARLPKFDAPLKFTFQTFFGPKSDKALATAPALWSVLKADRDAWLSFGWLSAGFAGGVKLFAGFTHNWGVAIILFTLCIRLALFPFTRRSQAAMAELGKKQAAIKPQIDELTKRYKDNPKKLNEERFRIYRENKVPLAPPLMGCLPLFLNIPIFVGFFSALRTLYDLRQEPFFLWVKDLSRPDELIAFSGSFHLPLVGEVKGLNVLPLIMMSMWVITQIVMQRNMPRPSDPQQAQVQKFAMVLSTVFGLTLYNYASGLSLYAITSSTITVLEQTVIRKYFPPATARTATSAPPGIAVAARA